MDSLEALVEENRQLKVILQSALDSPNSEAWKAFARVKLGMPGIPEPVKVESGIHKWEGEKCGNCGHSRNLHGKNGLCFKVNCDCSEFVLTGVEVNS